MGVSLPYYVYQPQDRKLQVGQVLRPAPQARQRPDRRTQHRQIQHPRSLRPDGDGVCLRF